MARFFLFLLILVVGWGLIFSPLLLETGGFPWSRLVQPASSLPQAWQSGAFVQFAPGDKVSGFDAADSVACGDTYQVARGDTLGKIAVNCGVSLQSLLAANAQIDNPNQVYAGQMIHIPALIGRGGGFAPEAALSSGARQAFSPGSVIQLEIDNMPPNAAIRLGIGLSLSGYQVLSVSRADENGHVLETIIIPAGALPGDQAFILATAEGVPAVQARSTEFQITP